ncbi:MULTISPECIES: fumarate reductase/succinate dehydrogenase flavoprotein subunit [Corynebacterium]|uniref:Fumarate reductase/succinate dehydrogenase flavoprotein subunit n=1 Tax=Corynebacterium lipophilum TaxID=2804918 RepID=A0AAW5HY74_9CORY|nr:MULTISPECIES: fumarate reductase/succinate dehydrogenase flavoprotein subunit [Corynebacterium]MCO6395144.1 fumarate reductase/succinate dehydrogenase flavoprotein subunit [Corynebacterium lipophilum]MCQ4616766.1 fumarate reductase/succinate dehydrogenase flavoprotein subunit [Corynebacterium pseudogenitalium]MCZ2117803.1 fumarate reductase/succinate dehydrogenase flavoprotein subunit [Corynebacterium lipophilum]MDK8243064.1 fumarate reductase/succinate dehydrogenase flavoprotein subunit [Co
MTTSLNQTQDEVFRQPESSAPGVTIGRILDNAMPDRHKVRMKDMWEYQKDHMQLVSPLNRRKFKVLVVGTGLAAGASAAALGELGYQVQVFTYHDAPRRAHSIAAQGGVNAARGKKVDNDGAYRHVKDTVKGGDYRCREADCWRLAVESVRVIDHMNAIGAPFAREYGGSLATRSFGGVQVSRTYYTRGQTGQQLQLSTASALQRQIHLGNVEIFTHNDLIDLIITEEDGKKRCRGIVTRNLIDGSLTPFTGHAVVLGTGGYGNVYHKTTLAKNSNSSAMMRAHELGAYLASPAFIQFHPTGLPLNASWQSKTTLMSESLRNDGRIWTPKEKGDDRDPNTIPEDERDYFLERRYPAFGNLVPRDVASRAISQQLNAGFGVGPLHNSAYLDFKDSIERLGEDTIRERYGNLFEMYEDSTGENPYKAPMRIAPTVHFSMGGLWTDFNEMTSIDGLFAAGECSWTYHGANRLGANSLLSASVDGWFTIPFTVPNYLADHLNEPVYAEDAPASVEAVQRAQQRIDSLMNIKGSDPHGPEYYHVKLGEILYLHCGVARTADSLREGIDKIRALRDDFWANLHIPGRADEMNQVLEAALRLVDYINLGELMCIDALDRDESCGAHYRMDHLTEDGEARRDDENWCFVSAWETVGNDQFVRHAEPLYFDSIPLMTRNYK